MPGEEGVSAAEGVRDAAALWEAVPGEVISGSVSAEEAESGDVPPTEESVPEKDSEALPVEADKLPDDIEASAGVPPPGPQPASSKDVNVNSARWIIFIFPHILSL